VFKGEFKLRWGADRIKRKGVDAAGVIGVTRFASKRLGRSTYDVGEWNKAGIVVSAYDVVVVDQINQYFFYLVVHIASLINNMLGEKRNFF
tara:strand:+ start:93 stop:365 length:273 start_codon:yes stop_codon:yes gene_type:complete